MRPLPTRAGALLLGTLTMSITAVSVAPAGAQTQAPSAPSGQDGTAQTAAAASSLRVTGRRLNVRAGRTAVVRGVLRPGQAGRVVRLERRSRGRWRTLDRDRTDGRGRFRLAHRTRGVGIVKVRARFAGDDGARPVRRRVGRLRSYRRAHASWYGPGLYGNHLGCGGRLGRGTVGVAHKSLPCGSRVVLRHRGRIVRTRVIDRGPYVAGREFDLTEATKRRLGFGSLGWIQVAH